MRDLRQLCLGLGAAALAASVHIGLAAAGTSATLKQECLKQLNMSEKACDCIGEKAESDLNANEQAFVVAMVTNDQGAQARLRGKLTMPEMTKAGMFMSNAPLACVGR